MTHTTQLLFLLFISTQLFARIGDNNDFCIISQNEYNTLVSEGKDLVSERYIVVPAIDENFKDIHETRDEISKLAKFSFLLSKNKYELVDDILKNCNDTCNFTNLLKGFYYFSVNQYFQSISYLEKVENNDYKFLKLLLIADCKYEILQDKRRYNMVVAAYQQALDNTDNEQNKTIITNRIKYIKSSRL